MNTVLRAVAFLGIFILIGGMTGYVTLRFIVKSENVVIVPDLEGKDVIYALELLTDLGLNTKVNGYEYRADIPKGFVVRQVPGPGTELKKDRDIRLILSKGPKTVTVPDLTGLELREARIFIADNGLALGAVTEVLDDHMIPGVIGSQFPSAGSVAERDATVDLLVGLGKRPVVYKMPDLRNALLEDVVARLQRFQLNLGPIELIRDVRLDEDVITAQDPLPGYPVASDRPIRLTVNREKAVALHEGGLYFFYHPLDYGFLKTHVRLRLQTPASPYDLVDRYMRPGEDLWMVLPRNRDTFVFVYHNDDLARSQALYPLGGEKKIENDWSWGDAYHLDNGGWRQTGTEDKANWTNILPEGIL